MIPGVNFQPGAQSYGQQNGQSRSSGGSQQGMQEAIKVLSLRLPKVVGAKSVAAAPLLTSQGSGGNPRVDSIVESVLSRMFPGQSGTPTTTPVFNPTATTPSESPRQTPDYKGVANTAYVTGGDSSQPSFSGLGFSGPSSTPSRKDPGSDIHPWGPPTTIPQIVVTPSTPPGDVMFGPDGRPIGPVPGSIVEPAPDLRSFFDWLPSYPSQQDVPLF